MSPRSSVLHALLSSLAHVGACIVRRSASFAFVLVPASRVGNGVLLRLAPSGRQPWRYSSAVADAWSRCHSVRLALVASGRRRLVLACSALLLSMLPLMLSARAKRHEVSVRDLRDELQGIQSPAPALWLLGREFVCLDAQAVRALTPEVPSADVPADTAIYAVGARWHFAGMVADEDWMGRQMLHLRFAAPDGRVFRFDTGRPMSVMADTTYRPRLDGLCPVDLLHRVDSCLRARTLYICLSDERVQSLPLSQPLPSEWASHPLVADSAFVPLRYVAVSVDSVSFGQLTAPLRVWFTAASFHGSFLTSLPDSREAATSTPIQRFLSLTNPRLDYPNISDETWTIIQRGELRQDMTMEEARLSVGRPVRVQHVTTRVGLVELWHYANSRVLEFWDGRLSRFGHEM